ncbi:MAG TPA: hypothetical protein VF601_11090 [Beijerinckiaceae bacterium]
MALVEIQACAFAIARALDPVLDRLLSDRGVPASPGSSTRAATGASRAGLLTSLRMLLHIRAEARRLGTHAIDLPLIDTCIEYLARRSSDRAMMPKGGGRALH